MRPDDGRVIPTFVTQALHGEDITVYGDGQQTRSFCYVDDLISGIMSVMRAESPNYSVYNLGNKNERTIEELANEVIEATDTDSNIIFQPLPEDDPGQRKPDITRVENDLDWHPKIRLDEGLEKTISYFKSNV
jgi:UDP-glucuronate decarboxylase